MTDNLSKTIESNPATAPSLGTTVAMKAGEYLINRIAPKGIESVRTLFTGKKLLVIGPEKTGKTCFLDYLQYGQLQVEQPTKTTIDVEKRRSFVIRLGPEGALELRVRSPLDTPGQLHPLAQVRYVKHYKPHCLVLLTDLSSPMDGQYSISSAAWLELFFLHLCALLRDNRKVSRRLKLIMIVLNKRDKVNSQTYDRYMKKVGSILEQNGANIYAYNGQQREITVMPSVLVKTNWETDGVDQIISKIATTFVRD